MDLLDRKIAHALQLDGRAAFRTIAAVVGASDQTVVRRYRKLRSSGGLRVLGLPDARRLGQVEWIVRPQCAPTAAAALATALAARPDTSWVSLTSGGTEIVCFTRSDRGARQGGRLLGTLPRTPRVVSSPRTACCAPTSAARPAGVRGPTP